MTEIPICEECGAYHHDQTKDAPHSPLCSRNTPEQVKAHLKVYFLCYQDHEKEKRSIRADCWKVTNRHIGERIRLQGKVAILKHENNQLRKKLYPGK